MSDTESPSLQPLCKPGKLLEQDIAGMAYTAHRRIVRLCAGERTPKWPAVNAQTFGDWCKAVALARHSRKPLAGDAGAMVSGLVDALKSRLH